MMLYICTKFQENISQGFRVIERMRFVLKFAKRHISIKHVDGDMVLTLSTMIDEVLYLYQVLSKYLIEF